MRAKILLVTSILAAGLASLQGCQSLPECQAVYNKFQAKHKSERNHLDMPIPGGVISLAGGDLPDYGLAIAPKEIMQQLQAGNEFSLAKQGQCRIPGKNGKPDDVLQYQILERKSK